MRDSKIALLRDASQNRRQIKPKFLVFLLQEHQNNLDISVLYVAPELKMTVRM